MRPIVEARVEGAVDLRQRADQWIQADGYFGDTKTVAAGIAAGTRTVTPNNMTGILVGSNLLIDAGLGVVEVVVVTAITATTFTAIFANAHANNFTVQWPFEVLADGGVRLRAAAGTAVGSTTVTSAATYFRAYESGIVSPYLDPLGIDGRHRISILAYWQGTQASVFYGGAQAWLNPRFDVTKPKWVQTWSCEIYQLLPTATPLGGQGTVLQPVLSAVSPANSEATGWVIFNFVDASGKVVGFHPDPWLSVPSPDPFRPRAENRYIILVHGYDAKGNPATNIGWGYDNVNQTFVAGAGENLLTLQGKDLYLLDSYGGGVSSFGIAQLCAFQFIPHSFAAAATLTFKAGSPIDLLATPASAPELVARAEVPSGTSATFRAAVDPAGAFTPYKDGQTTADIGLATQRKYDMQVTLAASAAGDRTPIARGLGARVVTKVDLGDVADVVSWSEQTDPLTHKSEVGEFTIRILHDGERDYRDAISTLLSQNAPAKFYFRVYLGDRAVAKDQWLHLEDGFPDDELLSQAYVDLPCVSSLSLLRQALPVLKSDQVAVPTADSSNPGLWTASTGTLLYAQVADVAPDLSAGQPDDTTYIQSVVNPVTADYIATLSALSTPQQTVGATIQFRAAVALAGQSLTCQVALLEGVTVRAFRQVTVNVADTGQGSYVPYQYLLTAAEQSSIGNWGNLNLRIRANGTGQIRVGWARLVVLGLRSPLVYPSSATPGNTVQTCMDDLLTNQIALDARYRGPKYTDPTPALSVAKTIATQPTASTDLTKAKNELDSLAWIGGWTYYSSQGRVTCAPLYQVTTGTDLITGTTTALFAGLAGPVRAVFPLEEIEPISVTAGWRQRLPLFAVPWGWNGQNYAGEAQVINAPAIAFYGQSLIDPETRCPTETAQWISGDGLGRALATRHGQSFGLGMMVWRFRTTYMHPELDLTDVVVLATDQFLAYDPIANRAIAGRQWALGVIVGRYDVLGREWAVWVQSLSVIKPISTAIGLPPTNPYAVANLIQNGDFEQGRSYWNAETGALTVAADANAYSGASAQLAGSGVITAAAFQVNDATDPPTQRARRTIPVFPGATYQLSAVGKMSGTRAGKVVVSSVVDYSMTGLAPLATLTWLSTDTTFTAKTTTFVIPAGVTFLVVDFENSGAVGGTLFLDNVLLLLVAGSQASVAPIPIASAVAPGGGTATLGVTYPGGGTVPVKWLKFVSPDDGTVVLVPAWPT